MGSGNEPCAVLPGSFGANGRLVAAGHAIQSSEFTVLIV